MFDFHYKSLLSWYFNKSVDRYYQLRKQVNNIQFYFAKLTISVHLWNIAKFFESCRNVQKFNKKTEVSNLKRCCILFLILKRITTPDKKWIFFFQNRFVFVESLWNHWEIKIAYCAKLSQFRKTSVILSVFVKTFWNFFWWKIWQFVFF